MDMKNKILKLGLRQDWIAKQLGISKAYLSMILNNKRKISKELEKKLEKVIYKRDK